MLNDHTLILASQFEDVITDFILGTNVEPGHEREINIFVQEQVPALIALGQTVLADGRITLTELIRLAQAASTAAKAGLNIYAEGNRGDILLVVEKILTFVIEQLFTGDEKTKKDILSNLKPVIQLVYRLIVRFI